MRTDGVVTELPAGCHLRQRPGGARVVGKRTLGLRILLGLLAGSALALVVTALLVSVGSGDGYAAVTLVVLPVVLGPMVVLLFAKLLVRHELVLEPDGVVHVWQPFLGERQMARVDRLGLVYSPATAESAAMYFLAVAHAGSRLTVLPGWYAELRELRELGRWIHEQTGVAYWAEAVTHER